MKNKRELRELMEEIADQKTRVSHAITKLNHLNNILLLTAKGYIIHIDLIERKVEHGCYGHTCEKCDKKTT